MSLADSILVALPRRPAIGKQGTDASMRHSASKGETGQIIMHMYESQPSISYCKRPDALRHHVW